MADMRNWQGAQPPAAVTLPGRWVTLEPLSAARHGHDLWLAVEDRDDVWAWLADGPYAREQELSEALALKETSVAARFFAIVPASASSAAGYASLMRMDAANGVIEVGNILYSPALQRTSAATEAIYLLARYVFEKLGYRRFEWKCNALNLPSRRAAERFGFVFEGVFRQHMVVKSQNRDTAWYSMLDSEWASRRLAFEEWLSPENFDAQGRQLRKLQYIPEPPAVAGLGQA